MENIKCVNVRLCECVSYNKCYNKCYSKCYNNGAYNPIWMTRKH